MKNYTITVNGNVYDVTVEEGTGSGAAVQAPAAAPKAAPAAAPKAAPAPAPKAASAGLDAILHTVFQAIKNHRETDACVRKATSAEFAAIARESEQMALEERDAVSSRSQRHVR